MGLYNNTRMRTLHIYKYEYGNYEQNFNITHIDIFRAITRAFEKHSAQCLCE